MGRFAGSPSSCKMRRFVRRDAQWPSTGFLDATDENKAVPKRKGQRWGQAVPESGRQGLRCRIWLTSNGPYVEPRAADGFGADPQYAVVRLRAFNARTQDVLKGPFLGSTWLQIWIESYRRCGAASVCASAPAAPVCEGACDGEIQGPSPSSWVPLQHCGWCLKSTGILGVPGLHLAAKTVATTRDHTSKRR